MRATRTSKMSLKIHLRIDEIEILCWRGFKVEGGEKVARKLLRVGERRVFFPGFGSDVLLNVTNTPRRRGKELKEH